MVYASVVYGSVKDSEFKQVFKELTLLTGSILYNFNYAVEESLYSSSCDKLFLVKDLTSKKNYTLKMNPPEPWNSNEPNVLSFTKSYTSLTKVKGCDLSSTICKVGYSFNFNGIEILLIKVIVKKAIQGHIWIVIVKSQDYTSDPVQYNKILKSVVSILLGFIPDLGSVDHTLLRLRS